MSKSFYRAGILAAVGVGIFALSGGFYLNSAYFQGTLKVGIRYLGEQEGQVVLRKGEDALGPWTISAPTIKCRSGHCLAYTLDTSEPRVTLTSKKGEAIEWVFDIVERFEPHRSQNFAKGDRVLTEGKEGYRFVASAKNGPFADWYLAVDYPTQPPADTQSADKASAASLPRLTLAKERGRAAVFYYLHREHKVVSYDGDRDPRRK